MKLIVVTALKVDLEFRKTTRNLVVLLIIRQIYIFFIPLRNLYINYMLNPHTLTSISLLAADGPTNLYLTHRSNCCNQFALAMSVFPTCH